MDIQTMHNEKKLGYYRSEYKENIFSKPQDIEVTITPNFVFGIGYMCEQNGTREEDLRYMRFSCEIGEITKVYIGVGKSNPVYIQCDEDTKGVINRKRIILPNLRENEEIINIIMSAKAEYDKKAENQQRKEKDKKLKAFEEEQRLREMERRKKAADREFETLTAGFGGPELPEAAKNLEVPHPPAEFEVSDILGIDDIVGVVSEELPKEAPAAEKTAEETAAEIYDILEEAVPEAPAEEIIEEEPEIIPEPEPEPEPAPAPAEEEIAAKEPERTPAVAPAPPVQEAKPKEPERVPAPAPAPPVQEAKPKEPERIPEPAPAPPVQEAAKPAEAPAPKPVPKKEPKKAPKPPVNATFDEIAVPVGAIEEVEKMSSKTDHADMPAFDEIAVPDMAALSGSGMSRAADQEQPAFDEIAIPEGFDDDTIYEDEIEIVNEPEEAPAPAEEAPQPSVKAEDFIDLHDGVTLALEDYQEVVMKLKAALDENKITKEEFAAEKSKLLRYL